MTILNEPVRAGEFLIAEGNGSISREEVTIASGQNLKAGTVVGKVTASGKHIAYANGASDGSQTAVGILYSPVNAAAADAKGVLIVRHAEVEETLLTGIDTAGKADLAAADVIFR